MSIEIFNEQVAQLSTELVKFSTAIQAGEVAPTKHGFSGIEFEKKAGDFRLYATITSSGNLSLSAFCEVAVPDGVKLYNESNVSLLKADVLSAEQKLQEAKKKLQDAQSEQ